MLGASAHEALYDLCDVPKWRQETWGRWHGSDVRSLDGWVGMECSFLDAQDVLHGNMLDELNNLALRYHVALPFHEAERQWLYDLYAVDRPKPLDAVRRSREAIIVSGGLQRVVHGRELLRRWWSWRRQTDEFSGQGTVDIAREALREMNEKYAPERGLPDPYRNLVYPR